MEQREVQMGSKYAGSHVKLKEVLAALPPLPRPLRWRFAFEVEGTNFNRALAVVEVCVAGSQGECWTWKRWGMNCSTQSDNGPFASLLLAAQQAYAWANQYDHETMKAHAAWDLGVLLRS